MQLLRETLASCIPLNRWMPTRYRVSGLNHCWKHCYKCADECEGIQTVWLAFHSGYFNLRALHQYPRDVGMIPTFILGHGLESLYIPNMTPPYAAANEVWRFAERLVRRSIVDSTIATERSVFITTGW